MADETLAHCSGETNQRKNLKFFVNLPLIFTSWGVPHFFDFLTSFQVIQIVGCMFHFWTNGKTAACPNGPSLGIYFLGCFFFLTIFSIVFEILTQEKTAFLGINCLLSYLLRFILLPWVWEQIILETYITRYTIMLNQWQGRRYVNQYPGDYIHCDLIGIPRTRRSSSSTLTRSCGHLKCPQSMHLMRGLGREVDFSITGCYAPLPLFGHMPFSGHVLRIFINVFRDFLSKQLNLNDSTNYKSEIQYICLVMVLKNNSTNETIKICVL